MRLIKIQFLKGPLSYTHVKPHRIVQGGWVSYSHMQHACYTLWNIKLFHFLVPACSADISTTGSERTPYITQKQALLESHMYLQVSSRNMQAWGKKRKVTSDTEHTIISQRECNKNDQEIFTVCRTCHFNTTRIQGHSWTLPSQLHSLPSSQYTSLRSIWLFLTSLYGSSKHIFLIRILYALAPHPSHMPSPSPL